MPSYSFTQHGFKWYVTARDRCIGEPFKHAADAQAEARRRVAENIPIPDLKPKRQRGRAGKVKSNQEPAPEVLAEMNG